MGFSDISKNNLIEELNKICRSINNFKADLRKQEIFMEKVGKLALKPIVLLLTLGISIPISILINTITVLLVILQHQMISTDGLEKRRQEITSILRDKYNYHNYPC